MIDKMRQIRIVVNLERIKLMTKREHMGLFQGNFNTLFPNLSCCPGVYSVAIIN